MAEQILELDLTSFSALVRSAEVDDANEDPGAKPVWKFFNLVFGNLTTKWAIGFITFVTVDKLESSRVHLCLLLANEKKINVQKPRLLSIAERQKAALEAKKESTIAKRNIDTNITAKCQLYFVTSENKVGISTEEKTFSFSPKRQTVQLGSPQLLECLSKCVNPTDDTLRVRVKMSYLKSSSALPNAAGLLSNLATDLVRMLESGHDSDTVIKCGDESFPVHKLILSLRSPVFNAMLHSDMAESNQGLITIEDMTPAELKHLLEFIYTSHVQLDSLTQEEIIGLIAAGDKYELTDLKEFCFEHLRSKMDHSSCGTLAVAAHLHNAELWQKDLIFEYIAENWGTLAVIDKFQELVKQYPAAFLKQKSK